MKYTIDMPPSINRTYKTGRGNFYRSKESHEWEEAALWTIKELQIHYHHPKTIKGKVKVTYHLYYFRDSDWDSRIKAIGDVLEKSGLIENDMNILEAHIYKHIDKLNPRVVIDIDSI